MSNLSKVLPVEERTFSKVYQMMRAKRAAMPQDALAGFRPRRKSGVVGITPIEPPEPEILKPLACGGIDGIDDDPEPEVTIPEVCAPVPALAAGEDEELEIPIETGDESESDNQDDPSGIEPDGYSVEE